VLNIHTGVAIGVCIFNTLISNSAIKDVDKPAYKFKKVEMVNFRNFT
jgi:hypothetical protein